MADADKIDALTSAVGALQARIDALEQQAQSTTVLIEDTRRSLSKSITNHDVLNAYHGATVAATQEALAVLGEVVGLTRPTPPHAGGAS